MNEEILKEILKEMAKPRKWEVGFVEARRTINDGLIILGMNATDILGFAKEENETKVRRTRGSQAWYKKMYEDGWRYAGNFEYEGLLHKGFVVMEREIPNKRLEQLIEQLIVEEIVIRPDDPMLFIDKGPDISLVTKDTVKSERIGAVRKAYLKELEKSKLNPVVAPVIPKFVKEPREGFESEINDFIEDAQKEMKNWEEIFFDETGRNAVWRGKETKAFKIWKNGKKI